MASRDRSFRDCCPARCLPRRDMAMVSLWRRFRREDSLTQGAIAIVVGMFVIFFVIVALLSAAGCGRPIPGERPGDDRPTVGPTFRRFPPDVARTIMIGAQLLNADGDPIPGRISVYADAIDSQGGRGVSAGRFPINTEVDSGWEYMAQVGRQYEYPVVFALKVTAVGLSHREQVRCYFQDGDPPFGYWDDQRNRAIGTNPSAPRTVNCAFSLLPLSGG